MQEQGCCFCSLYDDAYKLKLKAKVRENDALYVMEL